MKLNSRNVVCGICIAGVVIATGTTGVVRTTTATSEKLKVVRMSNLKNSKKSTYQSQTNNNTKEDTVAAKTTTATTGIDETEYNMQTMAQVTTDIVEQTAETLEKIMEADELKNTKFVTTISDESLNVRKKASKKSGIVGKLYVGTNGKIVEYGDKWTKIKSGKVTGYVATKWIAVGDDYKAEVAKYDELKKGVTIKQLKREEKERKEQERKEQEERERLEEQRKLEEQWLEEQQTDSQQSENSSQNDSCETSSSNASDNKDSTEASAAVAGEEYLLACLVQAEAGGEIYEGKLAVANVVLNRVNSGRFASTITDVIYQSGQFSVVNNGSLARIISEGPMEECVQAAQDALNGNNNVEGYYFFRSKNCSGYVESEGCLHIGNQIFYQ